MKVFLVISLVCLALTTADEQKLPKEMEEMVKMMLACKEEQGLSQSEFEAVTKAKESVTRTEKCFVYCLISKFGFIEPDGASGIKIRSDQIIEKARKKGGEERVAIIKEVLEECKNVKQADRCDFAAEFIDCMKKAGLKRGLPLMN